jgi:putative nucleotidyltransferase with HDIG domain
LSELATAPSRPTVGRPEDLGEWIDGLTDLPTIPEVLARIWQLVDDPRSSARDLEGLVRHEPPLAAKVLRLANSPYYGGRGRIQDVRTAITALGFDTLRNLAVCLSVASGLGSPIPSESLLDRRELWRHSVATAVIARRLARLREMPGAEELFTAGLLHDIGKFVIALAFPQAYAEIVRRGLEQGLDLCDAERAVIGFDHAQVGAAFAARWNFPERLQELIAQHHGDIHSEDPSVHHVLRVADGLAHGVERTRVLAEYEPPGPLLEDLSALGLDESQLAAHEGDFRDDIDRAQEFLNLV